MFLSFLQQAIKQEGDLSHAYVVVGETEGVTGEVLASLETLFPDVFRARTDVVTIQTESFGVNESRQVRERTYAKALSGRALFVLTAPIFTLEAQNALLKTLEEPEPGNYFFIVTESIEGLLPTLRSRLVPFVYPPTFLHKERAVEVKNFLQESPKERLVFVEALHGKKEKKPVLAFLASLEDSVRQVLVEEPEQKEVLEYLMHVVKSRSYLERSSGNAKLILETLALTVPSRFGKH